MKTFEGKINITYNVLFVVEAESKKEALEKIKQGDFIEDYQTREIVDWDDEPDLTEI